MTAVGERLQIGLLCDFRHIDFLEDVGIWPWTQQETPPFPMPLSKQPPPGCGFLSVQFMQNVVLPGFDRMPPCGSVERLRVGMVQSRKGLTAVITKQRGSEKPRPGLISPCQLARNQFREIVESVVADKLDLAVYFSIW
jgi:hypothetical protein